MYAFCIHVWNYLYNIEFTQTYMRLIVFKKMGLHTRRKQLISPKMSSIKNVGTPRYRAGTPPHSDRSENLD